MLITDQQYQRLMKTYNDSGVLDHAAIKAAVDPKTARRYIRAGKGPQELQPAHDWRTRVDPLAAIWPAAEQWLETTPELEAKMLFEYLLTEPTAPVVGVDAGALRTFQRRVFLRVGHGQGCAIADFDGAPLEKPGGADQPVGRTGGVGQRDLQQVQRQARAGLTVAAVALVELPDCPARRTALALGARPPGRRCSR